MGVSPKLVVGAWVGGEYRCIHFRTGALGQGSRTALPICGYFFDAILGDPAFKKYHGKFAKPKDADITSAMYNCDSYYRSRATADTTSTDSISGDETIMFDDGETHANEADEGHEHNASHAEMTIEGNAEHAKAAATESKKRKKPTYEDVTFPD